jgi:4-hydroxythreonine-4-phosphate dehydrogenase
MGDPAGIGLDIVASAVKAHGHELPPFILYGDATAAAERIRQLGIELQIARAPDPPFAGIAASRNDVLTITPVSLAAPVVAGRPDPANGHAVIAAIEAATAAVAAGHASAIVTAPISKETLYATGFPFPGHTEFLAELAARHRPGQTFHPVMMLACDQLRVVPLTIHIPLQDVPGRITADLLTSTARILAADLTRYFGLARPRIAIAGLNPHAGEGGTIGREEVEVIAPAIARLRGEGLDIAGPLSADTMFHAAARARYDAAICMYHDQALIPIKTLAFDEGVNVTLGLPFVRTSPDHGTAFDIAGTGKARPDSFIAALRLAAKMAAA